MKKDKLEWGIMFQSKVEMKFCFVFIPSKDLKTHISIYIYLHKRFARLDS